MFLYYENILIQTPVYHIFFHSVINNGRNSLQSPLVYDGEEYHMDFEDLERKLAEPNAFAIDGVIAAFTKGERWLDELRRYISDNKRFAVEYIEKYIPRVKAVSSQATYLMWIDCRKITENSVRFCKFLRESTGLYISEGSQYGQGGEGFVRINVACPRERLRDGLERLQRGVEMIN